MEILNSSPDPSTSSPKRPVERGMKRFLFVCAQGHLNQFRLPELESIARMYSIRMEYVEPVPDITRPFMLVDLPGENEARLIGSRAISVKHIWEYWTDANTYAELHESNKAHSENYQPYIAPENTWKFTIATFGRTISLQEQVAVIETFRYTDFRGKIRLEDPMVEVGVFEEFVCATRKERSLDEEGKEVIVEVEDEVQEKRVESEMRRVWLGRKICDTQRHLIDVFNLKKRAYVGNTSMEAEVSLLMANQALANKGKLVYDPFTGTGSMLLVSSAFGAMTFGSDIDGRQMRGKKTGIKHSADQYKVRHRILDCATFDMTQHPFRTGEIFDAIVTDPPYGVRAGAKRLGRKDTRIKEYVPHYVPGRESEGFSHQLADYVPPSIPWEMTEVISSLITYSLFLLKPQGRLVFFLPTDNAEYRDVDIPNVEGMRLISNSKQDFGKWARRLITMEKVGSGESVLVGLDRGIERDASGKREKEEKDEERLPGHARFSERYMNRFEKTTKEET